MGTWLCHEVSLFQILFKSKSRKLFRSRVFLASALIRSSKAKPLILVDNAGTILSHIISKIFGPKFHLKNLKLKRCNRALMRPDRDNYLPDEQIVTLTDELDSDHSRKLISFFRL